MICLKNSTVRNKWENKCVTKNHIRHLGSTIHGLLLSLSNTKRYWEALRSSISVLSQRSYVIQPWSHSQSVTETVWKHSTLCPSPVFFPSHLQTLWANSVGAAFKGNADSDDVTSPFRDEPQWPAHCSHPLLHVFKHSSRSRELWRGSFFLEPPC